MSSQPQQLSDDSSSTSTPTLTKIAQYKPKFNTVNELFRHVHLSQGVNNASLSRLIITGNVDILLEVVCYLLDVQNNIIPEHPGFKYSHQTAYQFFALNKGYITQTAEYNTPFYSLCCGDSLDLIDLFRILRSRTNWTSTTFRQAWLDSAFRHYKQWFVNNMVHVSPAQYQFYFFAKLIELMFAPICTISSNGIKTYTYGDCLLNWILPQIITQHNGQCEWACDIFGPFTAKALQDYTLSLYQRIIDSCSISGNWVGLQIFLSSHFFPDISVKPLSIQQAPRNMTRSNQPYVEPPILTAMTKYIEYNGKIQNNDTNNNKDDNVILPPAFDPKYNTTGLELPKMIRELLLSSRSILTYFTIYDYKNQIEFYNNLKSTFSLEIESQIMTLTLQRNDKLGELIQLYDTMMKPLTQEAGTRVYDISKQLLALYTQLKELNENQFTSNKNGTNNDDVETITTVQARITTLELEFQNLKDFSHLLTDDYKQLSTTLQDITITIESLYMRLQHEENRYNAIINSMILHMKSLHQFVSNFISLFGFDCSYAQDIFALQVLVCLTNDIELIELFIKSDTSFKDITITMEQLQTYIQESNDINNKNIQLLDEYDLLCQKIENEDATLNVEQIREKAGPIPTTISIPKLLTLYNVHWSFNQREHRKNVQKCTSYLSLISDGVKTFSKEQNIDFLMIHLLGNNHTTFVDQLMAYIQTNKIILPKAPPPSKSESKSSKKDDDNNTDGTKSNKKGSNKKGGKKGKKSPQEMMEKMMSGFAGGLPGMSGNGNPTTKSPIGGDKKNIDDDSDDDDDDGNDLFSSTPLKISASITQDDTTTSTTTATTTTTPHPTRKILNINDYQLDTNYIAYVCSHNITRVSTLRYLLNKKAKLYSNSKGNGPKSNAFLMCLLSSFTDPKSRDEMLLLLFDYCHSQSNNNSSGIKYNPSLTQDEYLDVLAQIFIKMQTVLPTTNILSPSMQTYTIYNDYNIYYQDYAELMLHIQRLGPKGHTGLSKILSNPKAYFDNLNSSFKFDFYARTVDLSFRSQLSDDLIYQHKRHVALCDFLREHNIIQDDLNNYDITYSLILGQKTNIHVYNNDNTISIKEVQFTTNHLESFPYTTHPAAIGYGIQPNVHNNYNGFYGYCDYLDPEQRLALSPTTQHFKTTEDIIYMKSNPFQHSFLQPFHKDLCVFFTQLLFGSIDHRAMIGSTAGPQGLKPILRYVTVTRCQPMLQFFVNCGYQPTPEDLQFCFYAATSGCYIQDVNFEDFIMNMIQREDLIHGFKNAIEWKKTNGIIQMEPIEHNRPKIDTNPHTGIGNIITYDKKDGNNDDNNKDGKKDEKADDKNNEKGNKKDEKITPISNIDDVDGQVITPDPLEEMGSPFDLFAADDVDDQQQDGNNNNAFLFGSNSRILPTSIQQQASLQPQASIQGDKNTTTKEDNKKDSSSLSSSLSSSTVLISNDDYNMSEDEFDVEVPKVTIDLQMPQIDDGKSPFAPSTKFVAKNEKIAQQQAQHQAATLALGEIDIPPLMAIIPTNKNDFESILQPFSLHQSSSFYRRLAESTNPIFKETYRDDVLQIQGVKRLYDDLQTFAQISFEIDCDYYFQQSHAKSCQSLINFCKKITYQYCLDKHPMIIEELTSICGTALRCNVPGATEYDFQYLFKNDGKDEPKKPQNKNRNNNNNNGQNSIEIVLDEDYDYKQDYEASFLLETFRLLRLYQSYFKSTHSLLYSPTIQCFLTLANALPSLPSIIEHLVPRIAWLNGNPLMAYIYCLCRSDPFQVHQFAHPPRVMVSFFMRFSAYNMSYAYQQLLHIYKNYVPKEKLLMEGTLLIINSLDTIESITKDLLQQQQKMQSNPMAMMNPGFMQSAQALQQQIQQNAIDSISPIITASTILMNCFPQVILKIFVTNPILMSICAQKSPLYEMLEFFKTGNNNQSYLSSSTTTIDQYTNNTVKIDLTHSLQPIHYVAKNLFDVLVQITQIDHQMQQLQYEFETRAQKCRSEKQVQSLQMEFQQRSQPIMMKQQMIQNQLYTQQETDEIGMIINHKLDENSLKHLIEQIGGQDVVIDENGQILNQVDGILTPAGEAEAMNDPMMAQMLGMMPPGMMPPGMMPPGQKGGQKGGQKNNNQNNKKVEIPIDPLEAEQKDADLLLRNVMTSKQAVVQSSSWFGKLISSTAILSGVAVVASAAYYAYQYWGTTNPNGDNNDNNQQQAFHNEQSGIEHINVDNTHQHIIEQPTYIQPVNTTPQVNPVTLPTSSQDNFKIRF